MEEALKTKEEEDINIEKIRAEWENELLQEK
jgi:hypothetical protein